MSTFDADAWLEAHQPWVLKIGGEVYPSRPVSILQCQLYEGAMRKAGSNLAQQRVSQFALLRLAFPWRWRYLRTGDPVKHVMALDESARHAVLTDFFESTVRRIRVAMESSSPSGNSSGARTPHRTTDEPAVAPI